MDNDLEILKEFGANKIHNDTHISREFIQAVLHESFEDLQSLQFYGFISILEKTYHVDLSVLKAKAKEYFKEVKNEGLESKKIFIITDKKKSNTGKYLLLIFLLILAFLYYSFVYVNSIEEEIEEIDNTKIENVQKNINNLETKEPIVVLDEPEIETQTFIKIDTNTSQRILDINITEEEQKVELLEPEEVKVVRTLKILPKRKIWAGYINIKTNQKYQKIFRKEFSIDTTKDWLLLFGSGTAKLEVNGEIKKYTSKQNMRFKYLDGNFSKITVTEFKRLNKGRKW